MMAKIHITSGAKFNHFTKIKEVLFFFLCKIGSEGRFVRRVTGHCANMCSLNVCGKEKRAVYLVRAYTVDRVISFFFL